MASPRSVHHCCNHDSLFLLCCQSLILPHGGCAAQGLALDSVCCAAYFTAIQYCQSLANESHHDSHLKC